MPGFECNQSTENVEHVHQFRCVLGQPAVGLDSSERGWLTPVTDDGPGAVEAAVTEPLDEYLLPRDVIFPHCMLHVIYGDYIE